MLVVEHCDHRHEQRDHNANLEAQEDHHVGNAEVSAEVTLLDLFKAKLSKGGIEQSLEGLASGVVVSEAAETDFSNESKENQI